MSAPEEISGYLDNVKALLRLDAARWRMVVERQVLSQVLPKLSGNRAALEPQLWDLLIFCLDGHDGNAVGMDDERWEQARSCAAEGLALDTERPAAFPRAAVEVAMVLTELRELGVYPPPVGATK